MSSKMSPSITVFDVQNVYSSSELPLPDLPQLKTRRLWDMVFTHGSYVLFGSYRTNSDVVLMWTFRGEVVFPTPTELSRFSDTESLTLVSLSGLSTPILA